MADIITTLHPINDNNTNIYPNVKIENIPQLPNSKLPESISLEKIPQMDNLHLPDEIEENKIPSDITASKIGEGLIYTHIINMIIGDGNIYLMFNDKNDLAYNDISDLYSKFDNVDAYIPSTGYKNNLIICAIKFIDSSSINIIFNDGTEENDTPSSLFDSVILAR